MLLKTLIYRLPSVPGLVAHRSCEKDELTGPWPSTRLMKPAGNEVLMLCSRRRREADLKEALPGLGETALQLLTEAASERGGAAPPRESRSLLSGQISELWKHDHPVRTLVGQDEHKRAASRTRWRTNAVGEEWLKSTYKFICSESWN